MPSRQQTTITMTSTGKLMAELQLALPARCYTTRSWILNIDLNKKLFVDIHTFIYLSYYPVAEEMGKWK